jgi:hypothetical protein
LVVAILGPAVQPWYLTWGLIVLAPVASSRTLLAIVGGSAFASFIGVPMGAVLVQLLQGCDGWFRAGVIVLLALLLVAAVRELWMLGTRSPSAGLEFRRLVVSTGDAHAIQSQTVGP